MPEVYSGTETFRSMICRVIQYIPDVPNDSEDIIIFGKIQDVHSQTLVIFDCLTAISQCQLKLNEVMLYFFPPENSIETGLKNSSKQIHKES